MFLASVLQLFLSILEPERSPSFLPRIIAGPSRLPTTLAETLAEMHASSPPLLVRRPYGNLLVCSLVTDLPCSSPRAKTYIHLTFMELYNMPGFVLQTR